ncbi:MAG: hypothetical protein N4A61_09900 [Pelagimonas sp.]|jgi:hypothetical protein|nr:hypothetical protein [Pelagimonas sp.]
MNAVRVCDLELAMYDALIAGGLQIKVALLIARTFGTEDPVAEARIKAALERLAQRHDIEVFGNINRWRHSEIRRLCDT